jgi:DNA repair protein RecO (recombination protein O)
LSASDRPDGGTRRTQPGLCLRRFPFGESSLVLHVLTPDAGRVALLAKGAHRPSSGYFAVFDLFDTLELRWTGRAGAELGLVTRAALRTRRPAIAGDLERYRIALGLLELAHVCAREEHEERALFAWLEGALDLLQAGRAVPGVVAVSADLALLRQCGLAPALSTCASCGARAEERAGRVSFSVALGGRLCRACSTAEGGSRVSGSLSLNVLRVAESLMAATPTMLEHTQIEAGLLTSVRAFVAGFLEHHLETRLRTRMADSAPRRR